VPLSYDPGTSWEYGVGSDWAGQMVERVTKQPLGSYMAENIWDRLGMNSTTFRLQERPDVQNQRADMTTRGPGGILGPSTGPIFPENAPDDHGGGGIYSSPRDYIKVLISLLKNDGTLLKPASTDLLFAPCLPPASIPVLVKNRTDGYQAYRASKMGSEVEHRVEQAAELNYALGGQVTEQDWRGGRKAGSMSWGGLPNLSWFVDRKSGIAVLCCSQLLPPGDHPTRAAWERFESAVYSGELGNLVTRS
jgi:CubicO group peptidase (beta-lactamase class C family)